MKKYPIATFQNSWKVSDKSSALNSTSFYSNGKLLLTGEYLVLDGALALALPTAFGQHLSISEGPAGYLHWTALHPSGSWFECRLRLPDFQIMQSTSEPIASRLIDILSAANQMQPGFLYNSPGYRVITELNFDRNWGLGSSSTLISGIARWADVDPFQLLRKVSGGSGYDIACATSRAPLTYQIRDGQPDINEVVFYPNFHDSLYFVYLGKKQDSESAIHAYRNRKKDKELAEIEQVSKLTRMMLTATDFDAFTEIIHEHEQLMSNILEQPSIQETLFQGFPCTVKSLGAWGGDFALLCSKASSHDISDLLRNRGFETWFRYQDMILQTA